MKNIPLYKVHMPNSVSASLKPVLESGYITDGDKVKEFEGLIGNYTGNKNVVTTNSCTSALTLSLFMAGVTPGDEVITSPMTCTATNMPIVNLYAKPVWCDIDPTTGMMNPDRIEDLITEKTKAILHVHWVGDVSKVDEINRVAEQNDLPVIEDAASAFGAEYKGKKLGNTGTDFVCFSFQAIKHITTGDGGAILFGKKKDAQEGHYLKRYGIHQDTFRDDQGEINPGSDIPVPGYNMYMNNIAATIGIEQMHDVRELINHHRDNGHYYEEELRGAPHVEMLDRKEYTESSYWVFTLLSDKRDHLLKHLKQNGIQASKVHLRNDIYSGFKGKKPEKLSGVEEFSARMISIPCGWWVSEEDREYIVKTIRKA